MELKLMCLSDKLILDIFRSMLLPEDIREHVYKVMTYLGPNPSQFVYHMFSKCSNVFVSSNSSQSPLTPEEILTVNRLLSRLPYKVEPEDVIIGDKVEMLFGSSDYSMGELTKFNYLFYSSVEDFFTQKNIDLESDIYLEVVTVIEQLVSLIESMLISSFTEEIIEDSVILILSQPDPDLYVLVY